MYSICSLMRVGQGIFSQCALYLGIEMDLEKITLNCLIVPIGKFSNIPCTKVIQSITIYIYGEFSEIETEIKRRLGEPFDEIPLKICQIQHGNVIEKQMDLNDMVSQIFTEPKAEHFHITVYAQ